MPRTYKRGPQWYLGAVLYWIGNHCTHWAMDCFFPERRAFRKKPMQTVRNYERK